MNENVGRATEIAGRLVENAGRVVLGKRPEIELVVAALVCRGHVLFEDVPGTAKTMLARSLSASIEGAAVGRIQCTPDLQPTDITGLVRLGSGQPDVRVPARPDLRERARRR